MTALNQQLQSRDEERDSLANMQDIAIERLNQQVLELSAQVEVMKQLLREGAEPDATQAKADIGMVAQWDVDALEMIHGEPSSALLAHDNEVAAKALEEAANTGDWWQGRGLRGDEIRVGLRKMATERRNRK